MTDLPLSGPHTQDIRHLPVVDDAKKEVVGMLSIKDLIKELQKEKDDIITKLSDFNIGKGAFFEHSKSFSPFTSLLSFLCLVIDLYPLFLSWDLLLM